MNAASLTAGMADQNPSSTKSPAGEQISLFGTMQRDHFSAALLNRYLNLTLRAWVLVLDSVGGVGEMVDQHASLLDAVIEGDAEKAAALARQHITDFENDIRTALGNPAVRLSVDRQRSSGI
jgi:DNA-binding GntR family transcriptional regulator